MSTVVITGIICITLVLLTVVPLTIAWSAEKSIKELIFGPTSLRKVWNSDKSHFEYIYETVKNEEDPK